MTDEEHAEIDRLTAVRDQARAAYFEHSKVTAPADPFAAMRRHQELRVAFVLAGRALEDYAATVGYVVPDEGHTDLTPAEKDVIAGLFMQSGRDLTRKPTAVWSEGQGPATVRRYAPPPRSRSRSAT